MVSEMWNLESGYFDTLILTTFGGEKMTQEEINTYMMALPYDAMGDFSVFREEKQRESQADSEKASQKNNCFTL